MTRVREGRVLCRQGTLREGWDAPATDDAENVARLKAFSDALAQLYERQVRLFVLPAGYLYASSWPVLEAQAERLQREASPSGIAYAVGIDLWPDARPQRFAVGNGLTAFTAAWSSTTGPVLWQQRSTSATNQWTATALECEEPRTLDVDGEPIELLTCGEIFNERIRTSVIARGVPTVVDLGHVSQRFRVHAGMKILTRYGVRTALCSVHCGPWGQKDCYTAGAVTQSSRRADITVDRDPRLEIAVWDCASLAAT